MTAPILILVGRRSAALKAASRVGGPVLLLDDRELGPRGEHRHVEHRHVDLDNPDGCARIALLAVDGRPVSAVVAVTERAVVAAAAAREALGLDGLGREAIAPWRDKLQMKRAVAAAGVPCADAVALGPDTDPDALVARLGLPLVIKPRRSSGTRGVSVVRARADLPTRFEPDTMAESFVPGTEMSAEGFVVDGGLVFQNLTEYLVPGWINVVPARLALPGLDAREVAAAVRSTHARVVAALGLDRGMTHMEVFVSRGMDGRPRVTFGEIAQRPPGGLIMDLLALAYGFDPWEAVLRIGRGERFTPSESARGFATVAMLHPGPGRVRAVAGFDVVSRLPSVLEAVCRVAPGDEVGSRMGTGQTVGHVMTFAPNASAAVDALELALSRVSVILEAPASSFWGAEVEHDGYSELRRRAS